MRIQTDRFEIRDITLLDANLNYLNWLTDKENSKNINTAGDIEGLESLKNYVSQKISDPKVLFLAILVKESGKHIGNIKFEPLEFEHSRTFLGVFIGDQLWRGKGVFGEIFEPISSELRKMGLAKIYLGVKTYNTQALNAYLKCGFKITNDGLVTGQDGIELCFNTIEANTIEANTIEANTIEANTIEANNLKKEK